MVDFYTELKLKPSDSLVIIKESLIKQERLWRKREVDNPDKATMMLALILQAKTTFSSEPSRRQYDAKLAESKKPQAASADEKEKTLKNFEERAKTYFINGEYDLAQAAVEKALTLNGDDDRDSLFDLAAGIYNMNGKYNNALAYVNKAIIINPNNTNYFYTKSLVLWNFANNHDDYETSNKYLLRCRECLETVITKAHKSKNTHIEAVSSGLLARSLYFYSPKDQARAVELAKTALSLGDDTENAQLVQEANERSILKKQKEKEQAIQKQKEEKERAIQKKKKELDKECQRMLEQLNEEKSSELEQANGGILNDILATDALLGIISLFSLAALLFFIVYKEIIGAVLVVLIVGAILFGIIILRKVNKTKSESKKSAIEVKYAAKFLKTKGYFDKQLKEYIDSLE